MYTARGAFWLLHGRPWQPQSGEGIDYEGLLSGKYDSYITDFASRLKAAPGDVLLRFAHEMNGNWYPWSGPRLGSGQYIRIYRHIKDIFDRAGCKNVKWVFSVNFEDVPSGNDYKQFYPGDKYVDYFGIDGYNWGHAAGDNKWRRFRDIFYPRYREIAAVYKKPVLITEFGSAEKGQDKAVWIKEAFQGIKEMKRVTGFILFDVDKEEPWSVMPDSPAGEELKKQSSADYFKDLPFRFQRQGKE